MSDLDPKYHKPLGGILTVIGIILVTYAFVRMNSFESQFIRAFGGTDKQLVVFFVVGIPCVLIGIWLIFTRHGPKSGDPE